jgi:hypothetical protein
MLHYIVFPQICNIFILKCFMLFWDKGAMKERGALRNGGQERGGERRRCRFPSTPFYKQGVGRVRKGPSGRTHAPDVRPLESPFLDGQVQSFELVS